MSTPTVLDVSPLVDACCTPDELALDDQRAEDVARTFKALGEDKADAA